MTRWSQRTMKVAIPSVGIPAIFEPESIATGPDIGLCRYDVNGFHINPMKEGSFPWPST